jgi:hypothetical protein
MCKFMLVQHFSPNSPVFQLGHSPESIDEQFEVVSTFSSHAEQYFLHMVF